MGKDENLGRYPNLVNNESGLRLCRLFMYVNSRETSV